MSNAPHTLPTFTPWQMSIKANAFQARPGQCTLLTPFLHPRQLDPGVFSREHFYGAACGNHSLEFSRASLENFCMTSPHISPYLGMYLQKKIPSSRHKSGYRYDHSWCVCARSPCHKKGFRVLSAARVGVTSLRVQGESTDFWADISRFPLHSSERKGENQILSNSSAGGHLHSIDMEEDYWHFSH